MIVERKTKRGVSALPRNNHSSQPAPAIAQRLALQRRPLLFHRANSIIHSRTFLSRYAWNRGLL